MRDLRAATGVAVAYFLTARLGEALAFPSAPVSALWAPNAILLAALVLSRRHSWWLYLLLILPAHLLAQLPLPQVPLSQVVVQYIANCSTALIGAWALVAISSGRPSFDRLRPVAALIVLGALIAPFASSILMTAAFVLLGIGNNFWLTTTVRSLTNAFAILTLVPLIVQTARWMQAGRSLQRRRLVEACLLSISLVVLSAIVFVLPVPRLDQPPALLYAPLPLLFWAAVRFGVAGACGSVLLMGMVAIWGVLNGKGPFAAQLPVQNALSIVLFLVVIGTSLLLAAALIEERSSMQSARRRLEALHGAVLASLQSQIAVLDLEGRIVEANDSWRQFVETEAIRRFDRAQVTDNYLQLCAQAARHENTSAAEVLRAVSAVLTGTRAPQHLETTLPTMAGPQWFEVSIEPLQRPEGGAVITRTNVTRRKHLEREAREQREQLTHLSRAVMLGELSGAFAHELSQPLASILSNAEAGLQLLKRGSGDMRSIAEILGDIVQDDLRATQVIERLRALLHRGKIELQSLDLNSMIQDVTALVRTDLIARNIQVSLDLAAETPPVMADRIQIQQVILNLVMNASEAMTGMARSDRRLTLRTLCAHNMAQCSVADRGCGIAPADADQIFEPFFTTKEHGLGLGLAICRSIIEAHGGRLWAESHPGQGAMFHFTLPSGPR